MGVRGKHFSRESLAYIATNKAFSIKNRKEAKKLLEERESKPKKRKYNGFILRSLSGRRL